MIVIPPFMRPDAPIPAIARPPMSMLDEFASAHIRDPISNMTVNIMYVHYT